MSRNLIGVDQVNRAWLIGRKPSIKRLTRKISITKVACELTGLIMLFVTIAILFAASSVASAKESVCYAVDHEQAEWIISDEMTEYLRKYGNGENYQLEDLGN